MNRNPPLSLEEIHARLRVDLRTGRCYWKDATKHHRRLNGTEAGSLRGGSRRADHAYWHIKINNVAYKRSHIVLTVATGKWPDQAVDHKNCNKLDDRAENLRHATIRQNNQNHQRRSKRTSLPMGVRLLPSGKYQARITDCGKQINLGTFDTPEQAQLIYLQKRKELFGDFA